MQHTRKSDIHWQGAQLASRLSSSGSTHPNVVKVGAMYELVKVDALLV